MKCNIDGRGRRVRGILGGSCCVIGATLLALGLTRDGGGGTALTVTGAGFVAGGLFQLFEARRGWCALRAMGIKTRV